MAGDGIPEVWSRYDKVLPFYDARNWLEKFSADDSYAYEPIRVDRATLKEMPSSEVFVQKVGALIGEFRETGINSHMHVGDVVSRLLMLAGTHRVKLEPNFVNVGISLAVLLSAAAFSSFIVIIMPAPWFQRMRQESERGETPGFSSIKRGAERSQASRRV